MLKHRLVTGLLVAGFFLLAFAAGSYWMLLLLLAGVYALAYLEFQDMAAVGGLVIRGSGAFLCGALYLGAVALETPLVRGLHPGWAFARGGVPLSEAVLWLTPAVLLGRAVLRRRPQGALELFGVSLVAFWYTALLPSFLLRIGFGWPPAGAPGGSDWTGRLVLVYCIAVVKLGDVGAYAVGMRFGQRFGGKLIPEISPAKSVMGLFGAYLGSVLASLLVALVARGLGGGRIGCLSLPLPHALAIGLMLSTAGVLGDLGESLFKRSLGIKDSGRRFPGMGGFLDVVDSLLFCAPFMYLYLLWVLR